MQILVVDDEPHIRALWLRWLQDAGWTCESAASAGEAWDLLRQTEYGLVVADVNMPGESGLSLLERVKREFGDTVAVIMATGDAEPDIGVTAIERGAWDYIVKPFDRNRLLISVANALERRRLVLASLQSQQQLEDRVRRRTEQIREREKEIAWRLMRAADSRDGGTGSHIRRVGMITREFAARIGWPAQVTDDLELAAAMHDIGKIGVPDSILLKPGPLTQPEREQMQQHTVYGAQILGGSTAPLLQLAAEIALTHHERWDGQGYPRGHRGEEIPETGRLVAIVDVYDALTKDRPYRAAMSERTAIEMLTHERARSFDPRLLETFLDLLPDLRHLGLEEVGEVRLLRTLAHRSAALRSDPTPEWRKSA